MPTPEAAEPFAALLTAHVEDLHRRRFSDSAQKQAQHVIPLFVAHLRDKGITDPRGVTEEDLVGFARALAGRGLALQSQHTYLGALKRFFAFLVKRRVILEDPTQHLSLPKLTRLPRHVLTKAQARRLMSAPLPFCTLGRRDKAMLETLYGTGIRRSECLRLDVTDLDLGQGLLFVKDGKGRKDRIVPLPGRAVAALDAYLRDSRPELLKHAREAALFLSKLGRRLSKTMLEALLHRYAAAAGLSGPVTPHVLRHTCATHLLKGGADVRHVQELLGHQSLQTTTVYTRVEVTDLREVLERCHPRDRPPRARRAR